MYCCRSWTTASRISGHGLTLDATYSHVSACSVSAAQCAPSSTRANDVGRPLTEIETVRQPVTATLSSASVRQAPNWSAAPLNAKTTSISSRVSLMSSDARLRLTLTSVSESGPRDGCKRGGRPCSKALYPVKIEPRIANRLRD